MMESTPLQDKVALVTGSSTGLGLEIAKELGVHPSARGLGHKKGHKKGYRHTHTVRTRHQSGKMGDISTATRRDVKSGWGARGHGFRRS